MNLLGHFFHFPLCKVVLFGIMFSFMPLYDVVSKLIYTVVCINCVESYPPLLAKCKI